jgi:hypothetical protein
MGPMIEVSYFSSAIFCYFDSIRYSAISWDIHSRQPPLWGQAVYDGGEEARQLAEERFMRQSRLS